MQLHTDVSLSETLNMAEGVEKFDNQAWKYTSGQSEISTSMHKTNNCPKRKEVGMCEHQLEVSDSEIEGERVNVEEIEQPPNEWNHLSCMSHRLYLAPKSENNLFKTKGTIKEKTVDIISDSSPDNLVSSEAVETLKLPQHPIDLAEPVANGKISELVAEIQSVHKLVQSNTESAKAENKVRADKSRRLQVFKEGDFVLVNLRIGRFPQGSYSKLKNKILVQCRF